MLFMLFIGCPMPPMPFMPLLEGNPPGEVLDPKGWLGMLVLGPALNPGWFMFMLLKPGWPFMPLLEGNPPGEVLDPKGWLGMLVLGPALKPGWPGWGDWKFLLGNIWLLLGWNGCFVAWV